MSTAPSIQPLGTAAFRPRICRTCCRSIAAGRSIPLQSRSLVTSGPNPSSSSNRPRPSLRFIPLSFFVLPPILWLLSRDDSSSTLNPSVYTDHPVGSTRKVSEQHKEVIIPLPPASVKAFAAPPSSSESGDSGSITVQHVMVKRPDLMIERPYTPVNNVGSDGEVKLVAKRVRGGEVGRLVHSLKPGEPVGLRGPISTFTIDPSSYDRIIMISSGTGVAPFLQLLSTLPASSTSPKLDLIHACPPPDRVDWISDPALMPHLQERHRDKLAIHRFPSNTLPIDEIAQAVRQKESERVMVLVCLPPNMMRPLCGPLTVTLQQGELTGYLRELDLRSDQVLKLE